MKTRLLQYVSFIICFAGTISLLTCVLVLVENLQLGRLDDCMKHYSILQSNLVSLVAEIDNYPSEESDVYEKLDTFGDVVRRSDLLQGFLSFEELQLPQAPLMMTCDACHDKGVSISDPFCDML